MTFTNTSVQSESILKQYLERELKKQQNYIEDKIHRFEISAALDALDAENIQYYQVVCESKYEACGPCKSLDRKKQPVLEAKEGVNLPPLHPNCRCTIGSYIESSGKKENISLFETIGTILKDPNLLLKNLNTPSSLLLAAIPHYFFMKAKRLVITNIMKTIRFSKFITPDELLAYITFYDVSNAISYYTNSLNKEFTQIQNDYYYYHPKYLQNAVLVDGEIVHPSNLSDLDQQILGIMKKRDASTSREEVQKLSQQIYKLATDSTTSIDISKPYTYYEMGRDTTDEILELMGVTEKKYAEQKKRGWVLNLDFFKNVVNNNGELDLKNLSAYQTNATYVFDGEIVDRDALGNITYGYFGRYLRIPILFLLYGAGYAQYKAGTSNWDFFFSYGDDPRDQYRIMQGILLYDRLHEQQE